MQIVVEDRFFTALNAVAAARLGAEHPCSVAAGRASRYPTYSNRMKAQDALSGLDPVLRKDVVRELESWTNEDLQV